MERILLFVNRRKEQACAAVEKFRQEFGRLYELVEMDPRTDDGPPPDQARLAIVFGGDGSVLAAARALAGRQIPLVGVNMGKMGFLAELNQEELSQRLRDILAGNATALDRLMLQARIRRDQRTPGEPRLALNDVVLSGRSHLRMQQVTLFVNDEETITYNGDGIIVATPVGSTAYSLSAGGPIVVPGLEVLVVTPICPHSLTNRSLVVSAASKLELVPEYREHPPVLTLDGQELIELAPGDRVQVEVAPHRLKLIETGSRTFFRTLRQKMDWGGRTT